MSEETLLDNQYKRRLPCDLNKKQVEEKKDQVLRLRDQIDETIGELEEATKRAKEEKSSIEARKTKLENDERILRQQVASGVEYRDIDCMEIPNEVSGMMEIHRLDVGQANPKRIVDTRPMNLLEASVATAEAREEAEALADAATDQIKEAKKKARKKGNGKADHEDEPDYSLPADHGISAAATETMDI